MVETRGNCDPSQTEHRRSRCVWSDHFQISDTLTDICLNLAQRLGDVVGGYDVVVYCAVVVQAVGGNPPRRPLQAIGAAI